MKIYLDNCCFNRPYDDPTDMIMLLEIDSKIIIQEKIKDGSLSLVWSFMLDHENNENPFEDIRESISLWKDMATEIVNPEESIRNNALMLNKKFGFAPKDSLHISSAMFAGCDYLLTTDKKMINKGVNLDSIRIINPIQFISVLEDYYAE